MELFHDVEFWIALAFVVAVAVLIKKAAPGIVSGLDARAARIKAEIEEAKRLRAEAEATLAEYQRKQRDALAEAQSIVTRAKEDAERIGREAEAELEAALKRREASTMDKIAQAEAKALAEVRHVAVDVAVETTRQLLKESLDQQRGSALIDQAIEELPQRLH
ncbi:MAG TPA: F0F1 ATP synthase subunit B [Aliidongia sp.]|nr:F0F1 ATP synthase subunit B [Aliidongia sp.]